jgi:hypothetical protein
MTIAPIAIETYYAGCLFRSRTEARWAVFFQHASIPWEYEREGYELPSGRYLPDFWLPTIDGGVWFEVKGAPPTDREQTLAHELAAATGRSVFIAWGGIPDPDNLDDLDVDHRDIEEFMPPDEFWEGGWDNCREFCKCMEPGQHSGGTRPIGIEFSGYSERICGHPGSRDSQRTADLPVFVAAYRAARSARFTASPVGQRWPS